MHKHGTEGGRTIHCCCGVCFRHYFVHGGFFHSDTHIFDDLHKIRHIPATIVQGRYDVVCPAETAWELHKVSNDLVS